MQQKMQQPLTETVQPTRNGKGEGFLSARAQDQLRNVVRIETSVHRRDENSYHPRDSSHRIEITPDLYTIRGRRFHVAHGGRLPELTT